MGKSTYQRSDRGRTDVANPLVRTSVQEQMGKRDTDILRAMQSLEAAAQSVALSIAALAESATPHDNVFRPPTLSGRNRRLPKEFGLAGDIGRVAYRLRLLQAAVDRATRRLRQADVSKG
jgi:hypothetical protein